MRLAGGTNVGWRDAGPRLKGRDGKVIMLFGRNIRVEGGRRGIMLARKESGDSKRHSQLHLVRWFGRPRYKKKAPLDLSLMPAGGPRGGGPPKLVMCHYSFVAPVSLPCGQASSMSVCRRTSRRTSRRPPPRRAQQHQRVQKSNWRTSPMSETAETGCKI